MLVSALLLPACFHSESILGASNFSRSSTSKHILHRTCVTRPSCPKTDSAQGRQVAQESCQCRFYSYAQCRCLAAACNGDATVGSTISTKGARSGVGTGVLKAFKSTQLLYELKASSCGFGALLPTESATTCIIEVPQTSTGMPLTSPCMLGPIGANHSLIFGNPALKEKTRQGRLKRGHRHKENTVDNPQSHKEALNCKEHENSQEG
jgi:hypothetical protein